MKRRTKNRSGPFTAFSLAFFASLVITGTLVLSAAVKQTAPPATYARMAAPPEPGAKGLLTTSDDGPNVFAMEVDETEGATYYALAWRSAFDSPLFDEDGTATGEFLPSCTPPDADWGCSAVVRRFVNGSAQLFAMYQDVKINTGTGPITSIAFGAYDHVIVAGSGIDFGGVAGPSAFVDTYNKTTGTRLGRVSFYPNPPAGEYEAENYAVLFVSSGNLQALDNGGFALALWGASAADSWTLSDAPDVQPPDEGPYRSFVVWCNATGHLDRWWSAGTAYELGTTSSVLVMGESTYVSGTYSTAGSQFVLRDTEGVAARTISWIPYIVYVFSAELSTLTGDFRSVATVMGVSRHPVVGKTTTNGTMYIATESCGTGGVTATHFNGSTAFALEFHRGDDPNVCGVAVIEYDQATGAALRQFAVSGTADTYLDDVAYGPDGRVSVAVSTRRWGILYPSLVATNPSSLSAFVEGASTKVAGADADSMVKSVVTYVNGTSGAIIMFSAPKLEYMDADDVEWNRAWILYKNDELWISLTVDAGWIPLAPYVGNSTKVFSGIATTRLFF